MQDSLVKRNFLSRIHSLELDEQECGYQAPRKFVKKSLEIEIPELSTNESIPLSIPSLCPKSSKFIFNSFKNTANGKPSTSTPTRQSDMTPKKSEFGNLFVDNNFMYDDYNEEEEFFSITMKKCNRKNMEDRATCEKVLDPVSKTSFFGVYDGHRNSYASSFLQKNLHKCVLNQAEFLTEPHVALKEAFQRLDKEICRHQEKVGIQGGSTALCALLNSDTLHIANVGDCKAVLIRNGEPLNLNVEHRADNNQERENVEKRGGFVFEKKGKNHLRYMVQGSLELTRSFGDQAYKPYVSCEPDIIDYKLTEDDQFLVIGSDGFWNELNERETADLINNYSSSTGLSKFLVGEALKNKSYNVDNITLIVVNLQSYAKFRAMMDEL